MMGQSDAGVLFGVVKDPSGALLGRAKVVVKNQSTGVTREVQTDARGLYYLTQLTPGEYELTVEADGFKRSHNIKIHVQVADVQKLDVGMELGTVSESVEVRADVSPLNTETVAQGTTISQEKIPSLPLNGRQFLTMALLVPGANPGGRAVQQNQVRQNQQGGLSLVGGRTNNTTFLLDGAINSDPDYNSLNYSPTVDGIAEFQVQTALVGAEYGRPAINVVTRSGGNEPHGTLWEFLRNRAFDARPFNLMQSTLPQYQRNQYGAALGGPIRKNKVFAFLSYEGLRLHQAGAGLTTVPVPTALQRQGDFSVSTPGGIFDPDSTSTNGVRQPFAGNRIPVSRINPMSLAALNALPLASNPAASTFVNASGLLSQNNQNSSGRMDYAATQKWNLFGRYSVSDERANIPAVVPGRDNVNNTLSQNGVVGSTYVLSQSLLNETRVGYNRLRIFNGLPELGFNINGVSNVNLPQFLVGSYPNIGGAGGFNATTGGGLLQVRDNTFQIYDNVSWLRGKHSVKFGGEIYHSQYNRFESANVLGTYQFNTPAYTAQTRLDATGKLATVAGTGDPLASFLLGLSNSANRTIGPSRIDGRQYTYSFFVQDDFRILPKMTLNLGLRYELAPPMYDARGQLSSIDYSNVPQPLQIFASGKTGTYTPLLFICGQSGYPKGCAHTDRNNFAPRVGIVYSLNPKTVVRTGAGIFYALNDLNPLFRLAAGLPGNVAQTLSNDAIAPRFSGFNPFGAATVGPTQIQAAGIDINQRTSYSMQYSFGIQREIVRNVTLEAGYLASLGLKLEQNVQPNNAQPGAGAIDPRRTFAGVQFAPGTVFPSYLTVVGNTVPVGQINYLPHSAQSNYHALYVRAEKRFTKGLSVLQAYTWSKAITNAPQFRNAGGIGGSENSPAQDSYNLSAERGLASFHLGQRGVTTFVYDLPFGAKGKYVTQGVASKVLGGLQFSGVYTMQTGFPFTINVRGDSANVGAGTGGIFVRPNAAYGVSPVLSGDERSTERFFNTAAFLTPPQYTYGNVGRNTVIGPGLTNFDMVVMKSVPVMEKVNLQLRFEAFNVANHSNYNIVGRIINDPLTFGKVQSQLDPRQLQLGAKVTF
jgi:hypothetical protein